MPVSPESPQALYHSVSQLPEASSSEIALGDETEEGPHDIPSALIDPKVKWINFILGCAVLLPWNGELVVP
jgi:equilibrative nucleoside transporter 1/2/3